MIVIDASATVAFLTRAEGYDELFEKIAGEKLVFAPNLIDYEVGSALRRNVLSGKLQEARAREALEAHRLFRVEKYGIEHLFTRMWELRDNVSYYDAAYVVLAEIVEAPLLTLDRKILAASGHKAQVIVY